MHEADIDAGLDEIYDLGVRQLELINKFDNGLTGVAGDGGTTGTHHQRRQLSYVHPAASGTSKTCEDPDNHDHSPTALEHNDDALIANGLAAVPAAAPPVPAYGPPPHCNQLGLSQLGEHALRRIVEKKMIFDPDHMSVIARNQALDVVESEQLPGADLLAQLEHPQRDAADPRGGRPDHPLRRGLRGLRAEVGGHASRTATTSCRRSSGSATART